jgi:hypothetical protein
MDWKDQRNGDLAEYTGLFLPQVGNVVSDKIYNHYKLYNLQEITQVFADFRSG